MRESDAAGVLRVAWGIDARLGSPHQGLSRVTWRVGAVGWLARESAQRLAETRAELDLLALLATTVAFAVPTPIPTRRGQQLAHVGDFTWTLCHHIAGERLGDAPSAYRHLTALLATVHRGLHALDPRCAVMSASLLRRARATVQDDARVLPPAAHTAAAWLRGRIATLEALPPQIIHGDFCLPNVLVDTGEPARFGILDWERSSFDSPIFDLAQIAFGMVAFSRSSPHRAQLGLLTRWYAADGGQVFSEGQLAAALVAGQLAHIAWLQGRVARGEATLAESVRFLDERLALTLRWLGHRR